MQWEKIYETQLIMENMDLLYEYLFEDIQRHRYLLYISLEISDCLKYFLI